MELTAQSSNVESKTGEDCSKQTLSNMTTSNSMVQENSSDRKQEEKMEIDSLIDSNVDDNDDIGEIHIVSIRLGLCRLK